MVATSRSNNQNESGNDDDNICDALFSAFLLHSFCGASVLISCFCHWLERKQWCCAIVAVWETIHAVPFNSFRANREKSALHFACDKTKTNWHQRFVIIWIKLHWLFGYATFHITKNVIIYRNVVECANMQFTCLSPRMNRCLPDLHTKNVRLHRNIEFWCLITKEYHRYLKQLILKTKRSFLGNEPWHLKAKLRCNGNECDI